MSILNPSQSFGATLAVMALDYGIYTTHLPTTADVKSSAPHNQAIDSSRTGATWTAIGACAALSLLSKDPNIFIFGAGFAVALDWYYRHANTVHPASGQVTMPPATGMAPGGVSAGN
jgi:hypothetical protein